MGRRVEGGVASAASMVLRRLPVFLSIFLVQMVLDQWTKNIATNTLKNAAPKSWLGDTFRLQYATNDGAFLSLGSNLPPQARYWILTIGVGVLLFALCVYALASKKIEHSHVGAYALIASGGFSNWIDRARFGGSVVDFMNMGIGPLRTGVFNVADVAILVGIGILFLQGYFEEKQKKKLAQGVPQHSNAK
jgi:signal peptidase II